MKPTAKQETLALTFNALAHPRRQMLFQVLQNAGREGMAFHHLLKRTGLTPTTLAFHLKKMQDGRIVKRKTKGVETWLSLNLAPLALFPLA